MKARALRTAWIVLLSSLSTIGISLQVVFRQLVGKVNRAWVDKTLQKWSDYLLHVVHAKCVVVNPNGIEPQQGQATILMCNHSSLYDIPISLKVFPSHSVRMLAKREMAEIPLLGKAMHAAHFPFIDRKNRARAMQDLAFTRQLLQNGIVMWIAPEGTRSRNGKLAPFKKGAFITAIQAQAVIIPIGIRGAFNILPARTYAFNLHQTAEIHIGNPIDASAFSLENKSQLMELVFQEMKQLVGEKD